jgi:hypothetical protein
MQAERVTILDAVTNRPITGKLIGECASGIWIDALQTDVRYFATKPRIIARNIIDTPNTTRTHSQASLFK